MPMPIDKLERHPPTTSEREKMEHRQIVAAGSSPFYPDERKAPPIDRSQIVSCAECHGHFLNDAFLAAHTESRHQPKPKTVDAAATELVRATIADRIESGELRVGQTVILAQLVEQLGATRHRVQVAVDALVAQGTLGYSGAGVTRRVIVV